MRKHKQLTTLEEDFQTLGILEENVNEDEETVEEGDIEEARVAKRRAAGGRGMIRTKRASAKQKRQAKQYYRKKKGKIKRKRKQLMKKSAVKKRMKWLRSKREDVNTQNTDVIAVLEDVQKIVAGIQEEDDNGRNNAIRAFADVAIISEMLSDFFSESVELTEDTELVEELSEAAKYFQEQAEQAAFVATALKEDKELDEDLDLENLFTEHMDALVDGLEFFADLSEEEEEGEEDLEEDDDDDEEVNESHMDRLREIMKGNE